MYVVPYDYVWGGHHGIYGNFEDPELLNRIIISYFKPSEVPNFFPYFFNIEAQQATV